MNKISKYKLENIDQQDIEMPFPATILSVVEQNDDIILYAIIDDDKDTSKIFVDILIRGTDDIVESCIGLYTFIGSVKLYDGKEIWHVFYRYNDRDNISEFSIDEFEAGMIMG